MFWVLKDLTTILFYIKDSCSGNILPFLLLLSFIDYMFIKKNRRYQYSAETDMHRTEQILMVPMFLLQSGKYRDSICQP